MPALSPGSPRQAIFATAIVLVLALFVSVDAGLVHAQQADARAIRIDSLETRIAASSGSDRIDPLVKLGRLVLSTDPARTMELASTALAEAEAAGDSAGVGRALALRSVQQYFGGEFEAALAGYQRGLDASMAAGDSYTQALILNDMGTLEKKLGDLDEALELFERGLSVARAAADSSQIANSMNNMGIVHDSRGEWDRAMELFEESAGIKERLGDLNGLTYNLDNMGMVSSRQGRYDQAEAYFLRAAEIRRDLGDERGYGIVLNNIGEMYLLKGDHERALPYFERALQIAQSTSYADFEQYIHGKISEVHAARGDHQAALEWFRSGTALKDSLFNEARSRQLTELQTEYETEQKEQTIALQQADLQRSYLLLGALVLLTGLIAIAYYLHKAREQLRIREAEMNASIASQERERRRIAQDLHDGLGQLITTARMHVQSAPDEPRAPSSGTAPESVPGPPSATRSRDGVSDEMLREMHREVRNIAFNLMPATLVRKGLVQAVDELGRRASESGSVSLNVQSHGFEGRQPEFWEIATYRIVQEWLSNVLQYASAEHIDIQITGHEDEIILMIEDDGVGLDIQTLRSSSGSGWSNIQSRARQIDGVVHIDSDPRAGGTTFILRTPVPAEESVVSSTAAES